jgi:hypothetical protein
VSLATDLQLPQTSGRECDLLTRERSPLADLLRGDVSRTEVEREQRRIERLVGKSQFTQWAWPLHFCREVRHELFVNEPMVMDWTIYRECVIIGNCPKVFRSEGYSFGVVKDCLIEGN